MEQTRKKDKEMVLGITSVRIRIHFKMIDAPFGVSVNPALLEIRKLISIILKWLKRVIIEEPVSRKKNLLDGVNEP
uniref:Uncharacterized protein n=1 Tax=Romanomermis culicivorax TaxID=13658 RepID=A0A915JH30_ROMCU